MRVIPLLLASLVIAGGCKKKDTGETDTGDTEDSGDSGGEDSGDTGDSGDSGDTDTGTEPLYRIFDFHYETEEDIPNQ